MTIYEATQWLAATDLSNLEISRNRENIITTLTSLNRSDVDTKLFFDIRRNRPTRGHKKLRKRKTKL